MEETTIRTEPTGPEAPKPTRPDNVPEKFWDAEKNQVRVDALISSYSELEKMRGKPDTSVTPDTTNTQDTQPTDKATEQVKEELAKKSIDFYALQKEYVDNNNALKPESYKALEDAGIPKSVVDDYITGQNLRAEAFEKEIHSSVGGKESFDVMIKWAQDNMDPKAIEAYNTSLDKGPEAIKLAVTGLHAQYIKATGGNPELIGGKPQTGIVGYKSFEEQLRDQRDPRYHSDPAFRMEVEQRAIASNY